MLRHVTFNFFVKYIIVIWFYDHDYTILNAILQLWPLQIVCQKEM